MQDQNTILGLDYTDAMSYQYGMSLFEKLRKARGLTQQQLSDLANTSQPQIQRLEKTTRGLSKEWAEKIAPHLGTTPQELMFNNESASEVEDKAEPMPPKPIGVENEEVFRLSYRRAREIEKQMIGGPGPDLEFAVMHRIIYEEMLNENS